MLRNVFAAGLTIVAVCLTGLLGGCATSVHSDLTINGERFGPHDCRNGQEEEFFGVDLRDGSGTELRIAANVDDTVSVIVFRPGIKPESMLGCSVVHLDRGSNDKRGYYKISGNAQIDCKGSRFHVKGRAEFDYCGHAW
jgi:hypothetical protein